MSLLCLGLAVTSLTATENHRRCPVRQLSSVQVQWLKNSVPRKYISGNFELNTKLLKIKKSYTKDARILQKSRSRSKILQKSSAALKCYRNLEAALKVTEI